MMARAPRSAAPACRGGQSLTRSLGLGVTVTVTQAAAARQEAGLVSSQLRH